MIEFNARLAIQKTEVVLPRLKSGNLRYFQRRSRLDWDPGEAEWHELCDSGDRAGIERISRP